MPPIFHERFLVFPSGEEVPEHVEGFAVLEGRDRSKWAVAGYDIMDQHFYALAVDVESEEDAAEIAAAALRYNELLNPALDSGMQDFEWDDSDSFQDRVYLLHPNDDSPRRFDPGSAELFGASPENPKNQE